MSTFHPEIDGHSHADIISMATVTKIRRLWIACASDYVHECMCASVCVHGRAHVCVCVCASMYVWISKI